MLRYRERPQDKSCGMAAKSLNTALGLINLYHFLAIDQVFRLLPHAPVITMLWIASPLSEVCVLTSASC